MSIAFFTDYFILKEGVKRDFKF